jgi:hypothetical protein
MKKSIILFTIIGTMILIMSFDIRDILSVMNSAGAPAGYCGDPAGGNVNCTNCHAGSAATNINDLITSNIPVTGYVGGTTYQITATISMTGHSRFGFEISPQNAGGTLLGTLATTNVETQLTGSGKYITHTTNGTAGNNSKTWVFNWTAPAKNTGNVTFYGAFNATNSSDTNSGDDIYLSKLIISENTTTTGYEELLSNESRFSVYPNPVADKITVTYSITEKGLAEIKIYNISGKVSGILLSETKNPGTFNQTFNLEGKYPSGIYFIKVTTGKTSDVRKILID